MPSVSITYPLLLAAASLPLAYHVLSRPKKKQLPIPPGPPGLPLLGNLLSFPPENEFFYWQDMGKQYGPVVTFNIAGQVLIVLNEHQPCLDLLRLPDLSFRSRFPILELADDAAPFKQRFILVRDWDERFKLERRHVAAAIGPTNSLRIHPLMQLKSLQFLRNLLADPAISAGEPVTFQEVIYPQLAMLQGAVVMGACFGHDITSLTDPDLHETHIVQHEFMELASAKTLLSLFPSLLNLPPFLSPYHRPAKTFAAMERARYEKSHAHGLAAPGWNITRHVRALHALRDVPDVDDAAAYNVSGSAAGGMDTTPRIMAWFFVAAATNPGMVYTAHVLLDEVVGRERSPTFEDRAELPYLDAVVTEVLRWRPVVPTGIPHYAVSDTVYKGMRIPRGAAVVPNTWAIGREVAAFGQDVEEFVPERWMEGRDCRGRLRQDLPDASFGYGRRTCPGKRVAEDGLWLQVARTLWAFDVEGLGEIDTLDIRKDGFTVVPGPFKVRLRVRGPWVERVLEEAWRTAEKDVGKILGDMDERLLGQLAGHDLDV